MSKSAVQRRFDALRRRIAELQEDNAELEGALTRALRLIDALQRRRKCQSQTSK